MRLDSLISGRTERRLPIILVVNVVPLDGPGVQRTQRTYTDNISPHGMRINSAFAWNPGEQAEVTPVQGGGAPMRGRAVYSQRLEDGRYFIGLHFPQAAIPWPILKRFDGVALTLSGDWNFAGPRRDVPLNV
jgi:hypothetical protein